MSASYELSRAVADSDEYFLRHFCPFVSVLLCIYAVSWVGFNHSDERPSLLYRSESGPCVCVVWLFGKLKCTVSYIIFKVICVEGINIFLEGCICV